MDDDLWDSALQLPKHPNSAQNQAPSVQHVYHMYSMYIYIYLYDDICIHIYVYIYTYV